MKTSFLVMITELFVSVAVASVPVSAFAGSYVDMVRGVRFDFSRTAVVISGKHTLTTWLPIQNIFEHSRHGGGPGVVVYGERNSNFTVSAPIEALTGSVKKARIVMGGGLTDKEYQAQITKKATPKFYRTSDGLDFEFSPVAVVVNGFGSKTLVLPLDQTFKHRRHGGGPGSVLYRTPDSNFTVSAPIGVVTGRVKNGEIVMGGGTTDRVHTILNSCAAELEL